MTIRTGVRVTGIDVSADGQVTRVNTDHGPVVCIIELLRGTPKTVTRIHMMG